MNRLIKLMLLILYLLINYNNIIAQDSTYTNPIGNFTLFGDVADPCVLKHDGQYYLYATSSISHTYGFDAWQSDDLVTWQHKGIIFDCRIPGNGWGKANFWAPEVMFYRNKFYLVYSARADDDLLKIAVASSDSPLGPFMNVSAPLLDENLACIDGHFFVDDDGSVYLFYAKDCSNNIVNGYHMSQIFVQKLVANYLQPMGDPVLAIQPEQYWECLSGDWRWNEGPYVIKHNDIYYLMFSANYFASADYSMGYATATNPLGPWIKYEGNPVLAKNLDIGVSGPGHNSVTTSPDASELFIVYHAHIHPDNPNAGRTPNIDRIYFDSDGILKIIGPTRSPQPLPGSSDTKVQWHKESSLQNFRLDRVYPNPFNSQTVINYSIGPFPNFSSADSFVTLRILNIFGEEVKVLVQKNQYPGNYQVIWDGRNKYGANVSAGLYICEMASNMQVTTRKMTLLK